MKIRKLVGGLLLSTVLATGVGVALSAQSTVKHVDATDAVVYLKPNSDWSADGARFEVWNWSNNNDGEWLDMSEVEADPGTYKTTLASGKTSLIFVRKGPSQTHHTWNEIWGQTGDLAYDSTKTLFDKSDDNWKSYTEPFYKYSINGGSEVIMTKSGSEFVSGQLSFSKGDKVAFTYGGSKYNVTAKDIDAYTKVKAFDDYLEFVQDYTGMLYLQTGGETGLLWAGQFNTGFYLMGVGGSWDIKDAIPAPETGSSTGVFAATNVSLAANSEIKLVNYTGSKNISYMNPNSSMISSLSEVDYDVNNSNLRIKEAGTFSIYWNTNTSWYSVENANYVKPSDGYYLVGDSVFVSEVGHSGAAWKIASGVQMTTLHDQSNKASYVLSVTETVSFRVKSYFSDTPTWLTSSGCSGTGISISGDNFVANAGTYTIYVNEYSQVYASAGIPLDAFCADFFTEINSICDLGGGTNLNSLKSTWSHLSTLYTSVIAEGKSTIYAIGFNGGSDADDAHKVVKAYHYIVTKYGTTNCADFIWGQTISGSYATVRIMSEKISTAAGSTIAIIAISTVSLAAVGGYFLFRKKKEN